MPVEKIIILRNEHPNEVSAFLLAKRVASFLNEKCSDRLEAILHTIPFKDTKLGREVHAGPNTGYSYEFPKGQIQAKYPADTLFFDFHNSPYKCEQNMKIFGFKDDDNWIASGNPDNFVVYDGADYGYDGYIKSGLQFISAPGFYDITIEIPAIYKQVTNERFLNRLFEKPNHQFGPSEGLDICMCRMYKWNVVDIKASKKAGLISDSIVRKLAGGIVNKAGIG